MHVENYKEGSAYYWNIETFCNRYDLMKDLLKEDIQNLEKVMILWDKGMQILLGYAFYKLRPLTYLKGNKSVIKIVSSNGNVLGKLEANIKPHDENQNEYHKVPEQPSDLIGYTLFYKVS